VLLIAPPLAAAQSTADAVALSKFAPPAAAKRHTAAQKSERHAAAQELHQLVLQVNTNEPAAMNLALNNAANVAQYYEDRGEKVKIEVVTFGPGLHMLRDDTSPVKARIKAIRESTPAISFKACGNTRKTCTRPRTRKFP
jgi:intracellular sulfur oxidation DsrE/DsrF family protein